MDSTINLSINWYCLGCVSVNLADVIRKTPIYYTRENCIHFLSCGFGLDEMCAAPQSHIPIIHRLLSRVFSYSIYWIIPLTSVDLARIYIVFFPFVARFVRHLFILRSDREQKIWFFSRIALGMRKLPERTSHTSGSKKTVPNPVSSYKWNEVVQQKNLAPFRFPFGIQWKM